MAHATHSGNAVTENSSDDARDDRSVGETRADAAFAFGAQIAGGGFYSAALFPDQAAKSVRLPDPVRPVSDFLVTRYLPSAESGRFVETLFSAVQEASPRASLTAIEFADYPGYRPVPMTWSDSSRERFFNHRTMPVRVARYRGATRDVAGKWFDLPHAFPWPYLRDLLIPFEVLRNGASMPGFVQPFHAAVFAPLQHWLQQAFAPGGICFTAFGAEAGTGSLYSNHQDHGGGLVPVTPTVAIVGKGMSDALKAGLRGWGIELVEAETPTETEHVDELFTVLPCPAATCGRALVVLTPRAGDGGEATGATVAAIRRTTRTVRDALRRRPGLADLPFIELPVAIAGHHTVDFNPVNMVPLPVDDGVLCLLGKPNAPAHEAEYRGALGQIGETLGCRIETRFIDLKGVAPDHKGSLHCATVELRS